MMNEVKSAWQRIEAWLNANAKEMADILPKKVTKKAIAEAETAFGFAISDDLRESYSVHDGADSAEIDLRLFPYLHVGKKWTVDEAFRLMSLDQILFTWKLFKERIDRKEFAKKKPKTDDGIENVWWSENWIPVAKLFISSAVYLCVDMKPTSVGTPGQVILVWENMPERTILAASWGEYLTGLAERMEQGKYQFKSSTALTHVSTQAEEQELDVSRIDDIQQDSQEGPDSEQPVEEFTLQVVRNSLASLPEKTKNATAFLNLLKECLAKEMQKVDNKRLIEEVRQHARTQLDQWIRPGRNNAFRIANYKLDKKAKAEVERLWELTQFHSRWQEKPSAEDILNSTVFSIGDWTVRMWVCKQYHQEDYEFAFDPLVKPGYSLSQTSAYIWSQYQDAFLNVMDGLDTSLSPNQFTYYIYSMGNLDEYGRPEWQLDWERNPKELSESERKELLQQRSYDLSDIPDALKPQSKSVAKLPWKKAALACADSIIEHTSSQSTVDQSSLRLAIDALNALEVKLKEPARNKKLQKQLENDLKSLCKFQFFNGDTFSEKTQAEMQRVFSRMNGIDMGMESQDSWPKTYKSFRKVELAGKELSPNLFWKMNHADDEYPWFDFLCDGLLKKPKTVIEKKALRSLMKSTSTTLSEDQFILGLLFMLFHQQLQDLFTESQGNWLGGYAAERFDSLLIREITLHAYIIANPSWGRSDPDDWAAQGGKSRTILSEKETKVLR